MLHYFPAAILVSHRGTPTWRHHTRLCNFARNISANISALAQRTNLKLRELSSLFIFHNITISWLYPLNSLWFKFLLRDGENTLYQIKFKISNFERHQQWVFLLQGSHIDTGEDWFSKGYEIATEKGKIEPSWLQVFKVDHSDGCVSIATIAGECTRFPFDRKDHCKMKFSSSYHIDQASTKFQTGRLRPEVKGLALPAI